MTNTFKSDFFNLGTTADTNLYTTPVSTTTLIKSVYIANTDATSAAYVSITVGATGATAAHIIKDAIIPIQSTLQVITEPIVLEAEDRINAQASATNTLDVVVSYMEIT